ncbi:MAG: RNA polymerase sigma factor [Deltaproteobacteria bacterium]|nr:RNA polymerase sigma factor [Deltaproteobacteria bacterium]
MSMATWGVMITMQQTIGRNDSLKSANELYQDAILAKRACEGDESATQQVVEQVFDRIWRSMSFMSNNPHDVDDLTQNALIAVLASLPTFRADCPLAYWAEKIAVRTASKKFEKHRRRKKIFESFRQEQVTVHVQSAEARAADEEIIDRFQCCLDRLSDDQRAAIIAHHINGYALDEIASMLGCSVFTIKGRLRRGRRRLKKAVLADPGLSQWVTGELGWEVP